MTNPSKTYDVYILSLSTLIVGIAIAIILFFTLSHANQKQLQEGMQEHINSLVFSVEKDVNLGIDEVSRMKKRWQLRGGIPQQEWELSAREYMLDNPFVDALSWVDKNYSVQYKTIDVADDTKQFVHRKQETLKSVQQRREPFVSYPIRLASGDYGFFVTIPIYKQDVFDGFIVGKFNVKHLFESVLPDNISNKYLVSIQHGDDVIFSNYNSEKEKSLKHNIKRTFYILGNEWQFSMSPNLVTMKSQESQVPFFIMLFVLSITLLMTIVIFFWFSLMVTLKKIKQTQRQLHESQKYEAIGQLAGGVAHEFNNILQGIIGCAALIKCYLEGNEKGLKKVDLILESGNRGAKLTKSLLAYARKSNYDLKYISVNKLCQNLIDIVQPSVGHAVKLNYHPCDDDLIILGDDDHLVQALMNLCINARDAMNGNGQININVNRVNELSHKWIEIIVSDNGSGMSEDVLKKIFEPFFTTKPSGKGTGLGLAMVIGTVKDHNGIIDVESKLGVGTSFKIRLPAVSPDVLEAMNKQSIEKVEKDYSNYLKDKNCLLIDDEQIILDVLSTYIEALGGRALIASNGVEGIAKFKQHHSEIDIIVLDWMMPDMNGEATYRQIRGLSDKVKIIISTGCTDLDLIHTIIESDKNVSFLAKPYQLAGLIEILEQM